MPCRSARPTNRCHSSASSALRRGELRVTTEVKGGALVVRQMEQQCVVTPLSAEADHAAIVGDIFDATGRIQHQSNDSSSRLALHEGIPRPLGPFSFHVHGFPLAVVLAMKPPRKPPAGSSSGGLALNDGLVACLHGLLDVDRAEDAMRPPNSCDSRSMPVSSGCRVAGNQYRPRSGPQ